MEPFSSYSRRNSPSPPPSTKRERSVRASPVPGFFEEDSDADQNFVFPRTVRPRPGLSSLHSSDDELASNSRLPLSLYTDFDKSADNGSPSTPSSRSAQSYREVRSSRGLADIEIPPPQDTKSNIHLSSTPIPDASASTPPLLVPKEPTTKDEVDLASPNAFQFPASATHAKTFSPAMQPQKTTHSSSRTNMSVSSHQSTYSLDIPGSTRRYPASSPKSPPSMARTRSATALPEPALFKAQDIPTPPLMPPVKPFAGRRDRSGSDSSSRLNGLGTPGLKDVLKVWVIPLPRILAIDNMRRSPR